MPDLFEHRKGHAHFQKRIIQKTTWYASLCTQFTKDTFKNKRAGLGTLSARDFLNSPIISSYVHPYHLIVLQIFTLRQFVKVLKNIIVIPDKTYIIVAASEKPRKVNTIEQKMIFIPQNMTPTT